MQEGMYITLLYIEGNAYVYLSPTLPVYVHMEEYTCHVNLSMNKEGEGCTCIHISFFVYIEGNMCTYLPPSLYVSTYLSKLMYLSIYLCIRGVCGSCLCIQSRSISVLISLCIGRETYDYLRLSVTRDMYMNIFHISSKICVYIYIYTHINMPLSLQK